MTLDQVGPAVIGYDNTDRRSFVAIKRRKRPDGSRVHQAQVKSNYLVCLKDMYMEANDVVFIYEQMDVSLRHITGILRGPLKAFQIAAICKELVNGLLYLHNEFSLAHGTLDCGNILLNLNGMVKIANVGDSFVYNKKLSEESRRNDVRSLGAVMMELMEPETYLLDPHTIELKNVEKCRDRLSIHDFLAATWDKSLEELEKHDFLPQEPLSTCLTPHVFVALRAARVHWDILSLP